MRIKLIILSVVVFVSLCFMPAWGMEIVRQKGVVTYIYFPVVDGAGDFVTGEGGNFTETWDGWADGSVPDGFTACDNAATEIGATGWYYLKLEADDEMANDYVAIDIASSTPGTITVRFLIRTIVGDLLNLATSDDGGTINVTGGAVDTVTTTTDVTNLGGTAAATQINNQVVDVISTDTYAEIDAGAPSATPTLAYMMTSLYEYLLRNKLLTTATLITLYKDDGTTPIFKATVSDNGTTFTREEFVTP